MDHEVAKVISIPASAAASCNLLCREESCAAETAEPGCYYSKALSGDREREGSSRSLHREMESGCNIGAELEVTVALATFGPRALSTAVGR
jgi:hypothetical protein